MKTLTPKVYTEDYYAVCVTHAFSPTPSVVKSEAPDSPVYLLALAPTADDLVDTLADNLPQKETESKENVTEQMDTSLSDADRTMDCSMDTFQNPFLKKPKREKLPI